MSEHDKIILPEKYYLDYFRYLLSFVKSKYATLLDERETKFIEEFEKLSEDAQCLYVRINNRKGKFFRRSKLHYPEISDLLAAHSDLLAAGYCHVPHVLSIEEAYGLINAYTKPEITQKLKGETVAIDWKLPKTELILQIIETVSQEAILGYFYDGDDLITQGKEEEWAMIKLFFFGHNHGDMSDFVIRDIGHARFIDIDESKLGLSFDTRAEAEAIMQLYNHSRDFMILEENGEADLILQWFESLDIRYFLSLEKAKSNADKLIHRVGYHLEKNKYYPEALFIYQHSTASPMRERQIRIYNKQKNLTSARQLAQEILLAPNDNKEYYIAQDVINKSSQKLKSTTLRQKSGIEISLSPAYQYRVEEGALAYFSAQGYHGVHSENSIWRSIFGLVFWEEIFDPQYNTLHQPLQRNPTDLYGRDFYKNRKEALHQRLTLLKNKKQIIKCMQTNYDQNHGVASMFVNWEEAIMEASIRLVTFLSLKQIKNTLLVIALDPKTRSSGFPDLFVWNETEYHFYEVKSPTDHLSEKQLFWLEHFDQQKINAEIVLVRWG
ncbi:VRR-NUC domain-containing protein [Reichenbachiella agarivorans]|uniref:phosphodiesterase I n=1 Tax=Reichenbachiella agarivorans TaxID=2979464 RepID=A0ABY6CUC3_9BACT|nr:VRR-NUC domain-containing protein [Reichenbachiella agarivorans]UXP33934.1 VRR-NUC domain-containing protein [Reichenbachiella agarivorans]